MKRRIEELKAELPEQITLVAVTKTHTVEQIKEAYDAGLRDFGENKVQEMIEKQPQLPADVRWHLIGNLQRNKVKYIASFVHLVHSIDSLKILEEINKQAAKNERIIDCLLQIHIAEEESKFGLTRAEATHLLDSPQFKQMKNISICGLMGMATFTDDEHQVKKEFSSLKKIFDYLKSTRFSSEASFKILSMGMSGDYHLAIEEGSTMVRIGTAIFGSR